MNLSMQGAGGFPENLQANDPRIVTGPMGDCVSVIVLYNYNAVSNSYANARGWHGLGGAEVINMAPMMAGVPNVATSQVIVIPGSLQQSNYAMDRTLGLVKAGLSGHGQVNVRYIAGCSNATVDRQGNVT